AAAAEPDRSDGLPSFADVLRALRIALLEVLETGLLPPGQLPPGCEDGIALTIEGDRFLLYRSADGDSARQLAERSGHAAVGPFVLRSTPDTMYRHALYEIDHLPEPEVPWSPLLRDGRVRGALAEAVRRSQGRREQVDLPER
ncbi:MAG TPA: hypothetical protein VEN82_09030, partial [Actinomycetota bacterium]|nr:hypothetical protein [Actinomycetota bacterium]